MDPSRNGPAPSATTPEAVETRSLASRRNGTVALLVPTATESHQLLDAHERGVLGSLLIDNSADAGLVAASDFLDPRHALIYSAIVEARRTQGSGFPNQVGTVLEKRERLAEAGGRNYLLDLVDETVHAGYLPADAEAVREAARCRRVADLCREIAVTAQRGGDIAELVAELELIKDGTKPARRGSRLRLLDWADVANMPPAPQQVEGLWSAGSLVVVAGAAATMKSLAVQGLTMSMVCGLSWRGRVVKAGSVLYLAGEGFAGLAARFRAWRAQNAARASQGHYLTVAEGVPDLSQPQGRQELDDMLAALVKEHGHPPSLVVVDTLSQAFGAGDENDAQTVAPVLRDLNDIRTRYGCTVAVVHHLAKAPQGHESALSLNAVRGSSTLVANVDAVVGVQVDRDGVQTLRVLKLKDGQPGLPIRSQVRVVDTGAQNADGSPERAPILVPAADGTAEPEANLDAEANAHVRQVVEKLREMGSAPSANSIVKRCHGRRPDLLAAFKEAVALGRIIDTGTTRTPNYVVKGPQFGESGSESARAAPPTPPGSGNQEPPEVVAPEPVVLSAVPGTTGNHLGTREPVRPDHPEEPATVKPARQDDEPGEAKPEARPAAGNPRIGGAA